MNRPKSHHFITQNQLERFADDDGNLFFGVKEAGTVICASSTKIMTVNELYSVELPTSPDTSDILYSSELESGFFSKIDGQWKGMCDEIVEIINNGKIPEMVGETRQFFSQYIYNAGKRVPEVQQRSAALSDPISTINDILDTELKDSPNRNAIAELIKEPENLRRVVKNATVEAVSAQSKEIIDGISDSTFSWLVPKGAHNHFVIGSVPLVFVQAKEEAQTDAQKTSMLFPVSKDICVEIGGGDPDGLYTLSEAGVGEINKRSVLQSRFCVGPDKDTIKRLFGLV